MTPATHERVIQPDGERDHSRNVNECLADDDGSVIGGYLFALALMSPVYLAGLWWATT